MGSFGRRTRSRKVVAGNFDEMHRLAAAGKGVVIAENLAELLDARLESTSRIPAPTGILALPVTGIVKDYSNQEGTLFLDRSVFIRHWSDSTVDMFRVYTLPNASENAVKAGLARALQGRYRFFVLTNSELKRFILRLADQWWGMTYAQIVMAVLVSILGIVNTLAVSITERKRELGILRAIGAMPGQVRRTIWLEAFTLGTIGLVLGASVGALNLLYQLEMVKRDITGMHLAYTFPTYIALLFVPVILLAAFLSAFGPAEYAVRSSLVEALEYE
jgi:putative ABC transport system permease protein